MASLETPAKGPVLYAPFSRRTWRAYAYLCLQMMLAPAAMAYVVLVPSAASVLAITVVGLLLVGALIVGARGGGWIYRGLAFSLLDVEVAAPVRFVRPRGFWASFGATLSDGPGWRAWLFMLVSCPLALAGFVISTTTLGTAVGGLTHWIWGRWLPAQQATDGTWHRSASFGADWFADTPARQ